MAKTTELIFIVDKSGSMMGLENDTIGGINSTIEKNKQVEGKATVTIVFFDTVMTTIMENVDIQECEGITADQYCPGGMTALLDAVGNTLTDRQKSWKKLPKAERPNAVVAIVTDGEENASKEWSYDQVKKLIEKMTKKGIEFLFLGANIDVAKAATDIGIRADRAAKYSYSSAGVASVYNAVTDSVVAYRESGEISEDWAKNIESE